MGRKRDEEKHALIAKLGASQKKNWSKDELLAMEKRQVEKEAKDAEQAALTHIIAGDVPNVPSAELAIPFDLRGQEDPFSGLTERQKRIARLRMRGLSQQAIANLEGISQPIISQELKKIKDWQAERGANVDQNVIVGNTGTLYEEVESTAWQLYYSATEVGDKAKCLAVVMAAREKYTRLLMDLGLIKKAAANVKHTIEVSPFLAGWKDKQGKKQLADSIVAMDLTALPEPEPEDVLDGELEEVLEAKAEVEVVYPKDDLEEPTLDDSEVEIES